MIRHREYRDPEEAAEFRKRRRETVVLEDQLRRSHAIVWRPWWLIEGMLDSMLLLDYRGRSEKAEFIMAPL